MAARGADGLSRLLRLPTSDAWVLRVAKVSTTSLHFGTGCLPTIAQSLPSPTSHSHTPNPALMTKAIVDKERSPLQRQCHYVCSDLVVTARDQGIVELNTSGAVLRSGPGVLATYDVGLCYEFVIRYCVQGWKISRLHP